MTNLEEAIHHLLWVWHQYGERGNSDLENGNVKLFHLNMRTGEDASEFLEKHGYGEDQGYYFAVNQKGCDLMHVDPEET